MTRSAQGIELTSAGKAFLDHARMALLQAEAAKEAAVGAPARPTFAPGFLSGAEIDLLPEVNRVLHDEFPEIGNSPVERLLPCARQGPDEAQA